MSRGIHPERLFTAVLVPNICVIMTKTAVCSICSKNYYAHARVLLASIRRVHPDWDCHFLLADEPDGSLDPSGEHFSFATARDLNIPNFESLAFRYDVIEFNVALKPFLIKHLLSLGYERVIYFDVDVRVFSELTPVVEALASASIVITPHITSPLPISAEPSGGEAGFLKNGSYNLGFIAVSRCDETLAFLDWWAGHCLTQCLREPETGLFVDQKWIDLVPSLYPHVKVLRHLGCNMAYWNFHERIISDSLVNGKDPLVFFHFSGVDLSAISSISKYQTEFNLKNRPDLAGIFHEYKADVLGAGHDKFVSLPYGYGRFENGTLIGLLARRLYPHLEGKYPNPFAVGPGTYHDLLRRRGLLVTDTVPSYGHADAKKRGRPINLLLTLAMRIFGSQRYEALMAYLRYISVLRRQRFLVE